MTTAASARDASNGGTAQPPEGATAIVQVLTPDGALQASLPLDDEGTLRLHRAALLGRIADEVAGRLAEQGQIGMCVRGAGRQAVHAAAAMALREGDWLFGDGREHAAALLRGLPLEKWAAQLFGTAADLSKGRQSPGSFSCRAARLASVSAPLGTHLIHAVGLAWAAKIRGDDVVSLASFDQAAVASADFHNALNFAGVFRAPTVFLCVGETSGIEAAELDLGEAYGIAHLRCEGSDPLAVFAACREAVERAAAGDGPTLVEVVLDAEEGDRLARFLEAKGHLSAARQSELEAATRARVEEAVKVAAGASAPAPATMVDDVFAELPWHLREQRREIERAR